MNQSLLSFLACWSLAACFVVAAAVAADDEEAARQQALARRAEKMQKAAEAYEMFAVGKGEERLDLASKPVLRWSNPLREKCTHLAPRDEILSRSERDAGS